MLHLLPELSSDLGLLVPSSKDPPRRRVMLPAEPYRALNCRCLSACGQRRPTSGWRRLWISPKPHTLPAASLIGAAGFSLVGLV
jgi:hypothetical protein